MTRTLEGQESLAKAHWELAIALEKQARWDDAAESLREALAIDPTLSEVEQCLGCLLLRIGRIDEAAQSFRRALVLKPDLAETHFHLGRALREQGDIAAAVTSYRRAIALRPDYGEAHAALAFSMNYDAEASAAAICAVHRARGALAPQHGTVDCGFRNNPEPARLRIGYVSADLHEHSVGYFFEPLLAAHDRSRFEIFCYSSLCGRHEDETTQRLKAQADHWIPIFGADDGSVAARVRDDRIDILIDLGGYTHGSRVDLFALKPAPVQVTWLGYPNTTGIPAIDYRITDAIADPEGEADLYHSEKLVRLRPPFLCYRPPSLTPPVAPPPVRAAGHITFGSFNDIAKLTPATIKLYARALHAVRNSRLVIKTQQMRDPPTADILRGRFAAEGIAPERLDLMAWRVRTEHHLARYGLVDIALDPIPYNGTTTTCEALWMGVPVVTLRGDRHAGRVGASLLTAAGLGEFVAKDSQDYVRTVVKLAHDLDRLSSIRGVLRERMRVSPLCDATAFARAVERAYCEMWERWCAQQTGPVGYVRSSGVAAENLALHET